MPVQMPYIQPLSFQQNNPLLSGIQAGNQIINQGLQNQGQQYQNQNLQAQAQYAPYNQYANAILKSAQAQSLPLQYMSTPLSNPMFMAALASNPGQLQAYMSRLSNAAQGSSNGYGMNIPLPGQLTPQHQGILQAIGNKLGGLFGGNSGNQPDLSGASNQDMAAINQLQPGQSYVIQGNQPQNNSTQSGNPSPVIGNGFNHQGLFQSTINNAMAPVNANPETGKGTGKGEGTTYTDPVTGQTDSSLTNHQTTQAQQTVAAIGRLTPLLNRISGEAAPFQSYSGKASLLAQQLLKPAGIFQSGSLPTQNAQLQADLSIAPESYVKAFGINPTDQTLAAMKDVVAPRLGESPVQYKNRITTTLTNLRNEELNQSQQQLKSGVPLSGNPAQVPSQAYSSQQNPNAPAQVDPMQQSGRPLGRYGSQAGSNAGLASINQSQPIRSFIVGGVKYMQTPSGQWIHGE